MRIFKYLSILSILLTFPLAAEAIPGAAESERIDLLKDKKLPDRSADDSVKIPSISPNIEIPEGAKEISFELNDIEIAGSTAFSEEELKEVYGEYLNKEVTLDVLWIIAGRITEKYRSNGYFLSRSFIPEQEIETGVIKINVVEGYIGKVSLDNQELSENYVIKEYINRLTAKKPIKAEEVESFLLKLNELPGVSLRAVVKSMDETGFDDGAIKLLLIHSDTEGKGSIGFDNHGSRFLGPYQLNFNYQDSFHPLHQTTVRGLLSTPTDELKYKSLSHKTTILPDLDVELGGSYVKSAPGFNIKTDMIRSKSTGLNLRFKYKAIRQRQENLSFSLELDGKNTNSNILGAPLTRDRVRAARASVAYDTSDDWDGYNYFNASLSNGLDIFGSSNEGDLNLSRAQATPDFVKLETSYTRLQNINEDFLAIFSFTGQLASNALFSSEELGFGGQGFGRAYDNSEITGDEGFATSVETRYLGFDELEGFNFIPYAFYDIGTVYNHDAAQLKRRSGASTGIGLQILDDKGLGLNVTIAQPLTLEPSAPQSGHKKNPKILFNLTKEF